MTAEIDEVEVQLARLVEALVKGGPLQTVVAQIKVEEERKLALATEYDASDDTSASQLDYTTLCANYVSERRRPGRG